MLQLFDRVPLENVRRTADGYLTATAPVARTGIQLYAGYEVDPNNEHGLRDKAIVRVNRSKKEVFSDKTLRSFAHRPVTNDHPPVLVDATNWKEYSVGQTGDEVDATDGKYVRVPLCVMDDATIKDYENGKRELSMGYRVAIDYNPGVNDDGEEFDVSQTDMTMNHLAIVRRARGGEELRIGDHQQGDRPMTDKTQTVVVDGISIETTAQGAQAIDKLNAKIANDAQAHQAAIDAKQAEIDALNGKLAKADADLAAANGKVLDDAALDARVIARSELLANAKAIDASVVTNGLSDADVRKAVVAKVLGDSAVAGKAQAYIDARFDIMVEDAKGTAETTTSLGDATARPVHSATDAAAAQAALDSSVTDMNAWRKKA